MLTFQLFIFIVSCLFLTWGADRFVVGSSGLARICGMSPLTVGVVLVGFATSFPEILVAIMAAHQGNPLVGVGSAVGSTITNIALVLGVTAMVMPMKVHSKLLRREYPLLVVAVGLAWWVLRDGYLGRFDSGVLLVGFIVAMLMVWYWAKSSATNDPIVKTVKQQSAKDDRSLGYLLLWFVVGLAVLLVSAKFLVLSAVAIAHHFGLSQVVIGLTVVAIGTSLPELATSIISTLRGEVDLAMGNIIGSNIFNLLAVLAMPGLIAPTALPPSIYRQDMPVVILLTVLLFFFAYGFKGGGRINRVEGACLVLVYLGYIGMLLFL